MLDVDCTTKCVKSREQQDHQGKFDEQPQRLDAYRRRYTYTFGNFAQEACY